MKITVNAKGVHGIMLPIYSPSSRPHYPQRSRETVLLKPEFPRKQIRALQILPASKRILLKRQEEGKAKAMSF
jgi:hypothetical protein